MRSLDELEEWERQFRERGETPAIPAATVVLLRDRDDGGIETLMLRRNSEIAFGGMWVFPGGRIDDEDHAHVDDMLGAARAAAVREAGEEAGLVVAATDLIHFAFWIPPPVAPRRFATWFFATRGGEEEVVIDDGEIIHHEWMRPAEAIDRQNAGEIELAVPTWVTLHTIGKFAEVATALEELARRQPRHYETHIGRTDEARVAMWAGDAGYEARDPSVPGARHRLELHPNGYRFDESGHRDPH